MKTSVSIRQVISHEPKFLNKICTHVPPSVLSRSSNASGAVIWHRAAQVVAYVDKKLEYTEGMARETARESGPGDDPNRAQTSCLLHSPEETRHFRGFRVRHLQTFHLKNDWISSEGGGREGGRRACVWSGRLLP